MSSRFPRGYWFSAQL